MQKSQKMGSIKKWAAEHRERLLWLAYVLLTLPQFNPMNRFSPQWEAVINTLRVLSTLAILVWALIIKRRLSPIVLLIGLWQSYVLLITVLRGGDIREAFLIAAAIVSVALLYDLMQDEREIFLSSQMFCFELMIYINLVTVLLFPGGMYTSTYNVFGQAAGSYYFLGYDSALLLYFVPALLILSLYHADTKWGKLRKVLLVAAILVTGWKTWAVATLLSCVVMIVLWMLINKLPSYFNFYSVWLTHIFFFVGVICLRMQNHFRWLIDGVLHKWNSLLDRVDVWDKTLKLISQAWLFGHGHVNSFLREEELGYFWATEAHNQMLELLYRGGIIDLMFFLFIIFVAGRRVYRHRSTLESKLITIAIFGWCLGALIAKYMDPFGISMFVIAYYSNRDALQPGEKDPLDVPKWDEWLRAQLARPRA